MPKCSHNALSICPSSVSSSAADVGIVRSRVWRPEESCCARMARSFQSRRSFCSQPRSASAASVSAREASVVPSVRHIRARFDERRKQQGGVLDRVLRRLLGLDLKALQYAEGKAFVDACVDAVGMEAFNKVWESPETLPTRQEIREPLAWVRRLHGSTGTGPAAVTA